MQHIGIVGCSAEGAALCYKTICKESSNLLGEHAHPEVSMHTHSLADYVKCLNASDISGVADLMLSSSEKLKSQGADFIICPDNTIHQAFDTVAQQTNLPWIHIAEPVTAVAKDKNYKRLGILGTQWLVDSDVYPEKIEAVGLEWVKPTNEAKGKISQIIMDELVNGIFKPDSINYFIEVISYYKMNGCDAVILGCTEIPLIINDDNSPLPTLDSTRLLAMSAIERAVSVK